MKTTLLAAAAITAMIQSVGSKGAEYAALVHDTAVQTILHAQVHGDATLADRLVKTIRETTPGYVWQGLVQWYRKNSPITWDEKGNVRLLKPDEKGYKPFNPEGAEAHPAAEDRAVKDRTDREIEPFSIALIKKRVLGMKNQLVKAQADGGRGVVGDAKTIEIFLNSTIAFMDKVIPMEDKAQPGGEKAPAEGEEVPAQKRA